MAVKEIFLLLTKMNIERETIWLVYSAEFAISTPKLSAHRAFFLEIPGRVGGGAEELKFPSPEYHV